MKFFLALIVSISVMCGAAFADGALVKSEHVGKLTIGMSAADITTAVGSPSKRGPLTKDDDGSYSQMWEYKKLGLVLLLTGPKKGGSQSLQSITMEGPCKLSTARDIHLGSTDRDVHRAYDSDVDRDSSAAEMIVAGTLKSGLIFTIDHGKVVRIFVGTAVRK